VTARFAWLVAMVLGSTLARAEPYLAIEQGLKCVSCHVNPTGGGMRNTFGEIWGQTQLPARRIDTGDPWTGEVSRFLAIGGNLRASASTTDVPHQDRTNSFDTDELRVYLDVRAIPERLSVYVDQQLAPGASTNREAYGRLWFDNQRFYVKAGQMFLPYGLRLQDDTAFIRQVPGINFTTPDHGVEAGLELATWSAQLAVSNGTGGGAEVDPGKQYSLRVEHAQSVWRAGASFNFNDAAAGKRQMQNVFAGIRTGPVAWLAEADYILDDSFEPRRKQAIGLAEANWLISKGNNLKLTAEYFDPDRDVAEDQQTRYSLVWEYTPLQFVQLRVGFRNYDGIPQNDLQNRRFAFAQINGYF
jgi:hypothetical protein